MSKRLWSIDPDRNRFVPDALKGGKRWHFFDSMPPLRRDRKAEREAELGRAVLKALRGAPDILNFDISGPDADVIWRIIRAMAAAHDAEQEALAQE